MDFEGVAQDQNVELSLFSSFWNFCVPLYTVRNQSDFDVSSINSDRMIFSKVVFSRHEAREVGQPRRECTVCVTPSGLK